MKEFKVNTTDEGQTLLRYVSKILQKAPSSVIRKALRKKNIDLNGKKASGSETLKNGDSVKIWFSDETFEKFMDPSGKSNGPVVKIPKEALNRFKRSIIYEDRNIAIVNKPANLLSQSDDSGEISLNDELRAHYMALTKMQTFKPSICNRLDRNTSGLVLCGLTTKGLQQMNAVLKDRSIHKYYTTIVYGKITEEMELHGFLTKDHKTNEVKVTKEKISDESVPIETDLNPTAFIKIDGSELTVLEILLVTGRSHQIRAHLTSIGHPIIGDPKYFTPESRAFSDSQKVKRQLLHSARVQMPKLSGDLSALSGKIFEAPLPDDMEKLLKHRVKNNL